MKKIYLTAFAIIATFALAFAQIVEDPEVKVLSINNSLIGFNDQDSMFNSMCDSMGKDARWTKHSNYGKTLSYHFDQDTLIPNAKKLVDSIAWTHIILQEFSTLPRTNLSEYYINVKTWVTYIRANCPNPDVTIILPINWAYRNDTSFQATNSTLIANTQAVADDFNIKVCPVAVAYGNYQLDYPYAIDNDLFRDSRHPSLAGTYLACCLEYATIFSEDPDSITWKPDGINEVMATRLRSYAQEAYEGIQRTVSNPDVLSLTGEFVHTEDFNSIGGEEVTPTPNSIGRTGVIKNSALPQGWRIYTDTSSVHTLGAFDESATATLYIGGTSLSNNERNGTWNFGATGSEDRAVGCIVSNASNIAKAINLMVHLRNDSKEDFGTIQISYDVEKYRNGSHAGGSTVQLYTSTDGTNWVSADSAFCTVFDQDDNTNGAIEVPIDVHNVSDVLDCMIPQNASLYLAWSIYVTNGDDSSPSMALAIDNITITPIFSAPTSIEEVSTRNAQPAKLIRDGQIFIQRDGKMYTAQGKEVR